MNEQEALTRWPKLNGIHPVLIRKISKVLLAMEALGYPMRPVSGVRTLAEQQALYAQGRTKPGQIVTNANGVPRSKGGTGVSSHQTKDDGYGHAVDCAFIDVNDPEDSSDDSIDWSDSLPWETYGRCATAVGLLWGGDWKSFKDRPHVELPRSI